MMNETMNTLLQRRSCRAYRPDPVEEEKLQAVLQAGLYAPSAMGRQSVTLVVVQDQALLAELETANAEIRGNPGAKLFYGAPAMVIVLADPEATNAINAQCDGALAMGNMMNAAHSLGLGSCWINRAYEYFNRPEGKALLAKWGLPERLEGVGNCILGYPAAEAAAPAPRKDGRVVRA